MNIAVGKQAIFTWTLALAAILLILPQADAQKTRHRTHNGGNTTIHELTYPSGRIYYNFDVFLTARNTSLEMVESKGRVRSNPPKEGYFEIYVDKTDLPITPESCKGSKVIVAMPWGGKDKRDAKNVQRDRLYSRITRLINRGQGRLKVVLESPPASTKGLEAPLRSSSVRQLDLSSCRLYFRTSKGQIVSHAGLLR